MNVLAIGIFAIFAIIFFMIQIALVLAVLKIPAILAELKKMNAKHDKTIAAIETADANRREEFESLAQGESAE